jgi:hypothetical protein
MIGGYLYAFDMRDNTLSRNRRLQLSYAKKKKEKKLEKNER